MLKRVDRKINLKQKSAKDVVTGLKISSVILKATKKLYSGISI